MSSAPLEPVKAVRAPDYWKRYYVTSTDPTEIELALQDARVDTGAEKLELIYFLHAADAPNILISQGFGGHAYVFAELAYRVHLGGFNVFVMPKHGGRTVTQLVARHLQVCSTSSESSMTRLACTAKGWADTSPSTLLSHMHPSSA
jgi:hypothetical protein